MSTSLKHKFASAKADGGDATLVRPSNWNAEHDVGLLLTNRTGVGLVLGDVVALSGANDESVILSNIVANQRPYVVALATIADLATGLFGFPGMIVTIRNQGAVTRGNYLQKSATTLAVEDTTVAATAAPPFGALAVALTGNVGSGTVLALLSETLGANDRTPRVLDRDVITANVVNTVTETVVYSFSVPGGTLGTNRMLRLTYIGDYLNNSGSGAAFDMRVKFGGTTLIDYQATSIASNASRRDLLLGVDISAKNATNAQVVSGRLGGTVATMAGSATITSILGTNGSTENKVVINSLALDSTTALTLEITIQHGVANANISGRALAVHLELI